MYIWVVVRSPWTFRVLVSRRVSGIRRDLPLFGSGLGGLLNYYYREAA